MSNRERAVPESGLGFDLIFLRGTLMSEDPEIAAMRSILEAMSELEEDSRKRVVQWLMNREGISSDALGSLTMGRKLSSARPRGTEDNAMSLSDFFYSVDPQNDM